MRVVVVDNSEAFRKALITKLLNIKNVNVIGEASNGKMFLNLMKDIYPDVVFMDIEMPEMNGIKTTRKAMEMSKHMRIIAVSAFDKGDYIQAILEAGARNYILKGEISNEILEQVLFES